MEFSAQVERRSWYSAITARPSIRLAALSKLPVVYIFTHDSVGVGEDGPTHEPVETVAALRAIPGLDVIRPADPEETAGAFAAAFQRTEGPTLLALTRQNLPTLNEIPVELRREGVFKGGYVAKKEAAALEMILLASGSELQHALKAADELGPGTRVVSMPCFERFERQDAAYKESVLPDAVRQPCLDRGRCFRSVVSLCGSGRKDGFHRSLRHERTRRQSDGSARHDASESRRGRAISSLDAFASDSKESPRLVTKRW